MEKPIIFSGPMVKAILEGRKTQTRRIIKPQPPRSLYNNKGSGYWITVEIDGHSHGPWQCPYGSKGDLLWVKETYAIESNWLIESNEKYPPPFNDGRPINWLEEEGVKFWEQCHYRATDPTPELCYHNDVDNEPTVKWRPSIFMFKWACRLWIEILDVRVERLQDISEEDAKAEGSQIPCAELPKSCQQATLTERTQFSRIWDSINGKKHPWENNPWVWVIEFKKVIPKTQASPHAIGAG